MGDHTGEASLYSGDHQAALREAPDAFYLFGAVRSPSAEIVDFELLDGNAMVERRFGRPLKELIGKRLSELAPSVVGTDLFAAYVRVHEQGETFERDFALREPTLPIDTIHLRALRTPSGIGVFARDVSRYRAGEAALRLSEERFRLLIDSVRDYAILMLDTEGRVTSWNQGAERINGYNAEEIIGRNVGVFYPREAVEAGRPEAELRLALATGRFEEEGVRVRKSGARFIANVVVTPLFDGGIHRGFAKVTRDVTARKEAEVAQHKSLQEKEVLLKEVHHRVKNNLQVIGSLLRLQSERLEDPLARAAFANSYDRVRSIAALHETLYRSDDLGEVALDQYVERLVTSLVRAQGSGPEVDIRISAADISLPLDRAVPVGLIINELVTNALKHAFVGSTRSSAKVEISLTRDHGRFVLVVSDDGVGLPDAVTARGPDRGRASLGMHLVSTLAKQLRGQLEWSAGAGARCTLTFPEKQENPS